VCGEAENGQSAAEIVDQLHPDLIILDLSMPVMDGLDAAPIRKKLPHTPIILYTMYGDAAVEQLAAVAGIAAVVSKSDPVAHLLRKAKTLVGTP
jgi:CheY-like chemotaxis protein